MKPRKIEFYVYEEADGESAVLEKALRDFVERQRSAGIAVTATKLTHALDFFGKSPLVARYLSTL